MTDEAKTTVKNCVNRTINLQTLLFIVYAQA